MKKKWWNIITLVILLLIIFLPTNINPIAVLHETAHFAVGTSIGKSCIILYAPFSGNISFNSNEVYDFDQEQHTYVAFKKFPDNSIRSVKYNKSFRVNGAPAITLCSSMTIASPIQRQIFGLAGLLVEFLLYIIIALILPLSILSAGYFLYTGTWFIVFLAGFLYNSDLHITLLYGLSPFVVFGITVIYLILGIFLLVRYVNCYIFSIKGKKRHLNKVKKKKN